MLKRLLRNLRQQPKSTRDSVAFMLAGLFTFAVFSVWAFNVPDRLALMNDETETAEEEAGSSFGSIFSGIRDQVAGVVDSFESADVPVETGDATASATPTINNQIDIQALLDDFANQSGTSSQVESNTAVDSEMTGREVRIITTQSASSATSTAD
jgi:hypothetical protein